MALSNNVNRTVKQLPKDTYINLKRPMFYVVTSSLFLMAGMQAANAEVCAPDIKYLLPQITSTSVKNSINENSINDTTLDAHAYGGKSAIEHYEEEISYYKEGLQERQDISWVERIKYDEEMIKQIKCLSNGGKVAATSADFDINGNYKGSTQQASNKKSKSGKGNNQEQIATADSNTNGTNSADSNNAESSDSKSKGKEFAKDEKRLHANACVSVIRKKNQGPAFKNICPYPIEVVWCANSKEDPNQCDRGWNGQWNFGVGHSEPINATSATHWVVAACKGENSLYMNEELKRNKKLRCVNWKN